MTSIVAIQINTMEVNCVFTILFKIHFYVCIICVQQKKEIHTGLEQFENA